MVISVEINPKWSVEKSERIHKEKGEIIKVIERVVPLDTFGLRLFSRMVVITLWAQDIVNQEKITKLPQFESEDR